MYVEMKKGSQQVKVIPDQVPTMKNRGYTEVKPLAKETKKEVNKDGKA